MMKSCIFSFFIIFFFKVFVSCDKSYNCNSNNTIFLDINEIAFYETTNFPKLLSYNEFEMCNVTFVYTGNTKYILNVFKRLLINSDGSIDEKRAFHSLFESFHSINDAYFITGPPDGVAIQGYVIFEPEINKFPLESFFKKNSFQFSNEKEFFYIQSYYDYETYEFIDNFSCFWQFSAPDGYGFKIVLTDLSILRYSPSTQLLIKNSTDIILNERSADEDHPYYNSDYYIEIQLKNFLLSGNEFEAYVTIVKNKFQTTEGECLISYDNNEGAIIWTSPEGYENNIQCIYNLAVPPKSQAIIYSSYYALEDNVDNVYYYLEDNVRVAVSQVSFDKVDFIIPSFNTNLTRNVSFEFLSDGSIQSFGFQLFFKVTACECSQNFLPCDGNYYPLASSPKSYCGNMHCNFTVLPCPTNLTLISYTILYESVTPSNENFDEIKIISGNDTIMPKKQYDSFYNHLYYIVNTKSRNIVNVLTYPSGKARSLNFTITPFTARPLDRTIQLLPNFTSYILDTGFYDFVMFEILLNKTVTFEIYFDYTPKIFYWYPDETVVHGNVCLPKFDDNYKCEIKSNKFAFYMISDFPVLVIKLKEKKNNCVFNKDLFHTLNPRDKTLLEYVSNIATPDGECEIFIQNQVFSRKIKYIWTNAVAHNVKVFIGGEPRKLLFEFNNKMATNWKDIALSPGVYTIIIPKSAAVIIKLSSDDYDYYSQMVTEINSYPYQSLFATTYYGLSTRQVTYQILTKLMNFDIGNFTTRFTVFDYNIPAGDNFYLTVDNKQYHFKEAGDFYEFKENTVSLFNSAQKGRKRHGALIFIETMKQ